MTTTDLRCPECGSLVRAGVSWCSLCLADVRSDEEKEAARLEAEQLAGTGITLPGTTPLGSPDDRLTAAAPARGRHARPSTLPTAPVVRAPALPNRPADALPAADQQASAAATAAETEEKLAELREAGIDVDGMLQMLASNAATDPLTGLVDRMSSKGSRAIVVIVASTALTAIGIGLMFLLGWLFG